MPRFMEQLRAGVTIRKPTSCDRLVLLRLEHYEASVPEHNDLHPHLLQAALLPEMMYSLNEYVDAPYRRHIESSLFSIIAIE